MTRNMFVDIKNVSKNLTNFSLENLNISFEKGEIIGLVGENGAGKTTLLNLISGILKPDKGQILLSSNNIGYCFDALPEPENLTIEQLNTIFTGLLAVWDSDTYFSFVDEFKLPKGKPIGVFSKGMKMQLNVSITLSHNPTLLLLDEPFSALDYQTRLKVADDIGTIIKQEEKTAILVTHDLSEAVSLANRVIVLSERPAQIAAVVPLEFEESLTPFERRAAPQFKDYFNIIWKELNHDE